MEEIEAEKEIRGGIGSDNMTTREDRKENKKATQHQT